jgi:hypothetical protein
MGGVLRFNTYITDMSNRQINCWIQDDTYELIAQRAKQSHLKPSAYGAMILNNWAEKQDAMTPVEQELKDLRARIGEVEDSNK